SRGHRAVEALLRVRLHLEIRAGALDRDEREHDEAGYQDDQIRDASHGHELSSTERLHLVNQNGRRGVASTAATKRAPDASGRTPRTGIKPGDRHPSSR